MKNFLINSLGLRRDKKRKDSETEESGGATDTAPTESAKPKEKESKSKRSSTAGSESTSAATAAGANSVSDSCNGSLSSKKKSAASSSVHPLPPPPPPPPHVAASSPADPHNPSQLALQKSTLNDSDDSVTRGADLFPVAQCEISITQVSEVFQVFKPFVDSCSSTPVKLSSLAKLRHILPSIADVNTTVTAATVEAQGFDPSFAIEPMLNHLLMQPAPLRARLCLAIYRFSGTMTEELEDEMLSPEAGLFSGLQALNPNLYNNNSDGGMQGYAASLHSNTSAIAPALSRCPDIDLAKIYHSLLHKADYLPTAEELHEICLRAQDLLRREPNVLSIGLPAVLVGDLHGQVRDLLENVLPLGGPLVPASTLSSAAAAASASRKTKASANGSGVGRGIPKRSNGSDSNTETAGAADAVPTGDAPPCNYLFLGDYVDRGPDSLRVLAVLFTAKVLSPSTVFLLRGNHECANTNRFYGFLEECHRRYPIVKNKVTSLQLCTLSPSEDDAEAAREATGGVSSSSSSGPGSRAEVQAAMDAINAASAAEGCDMSWDMSDHPLWLATNEAFKLLPLCAALYEEVEMEETITATLSSATPVEEGGEKGSAKRNKSSSCGSFSTNSSMAAEPTGKSPKVGGKKPPSGVLPLASSAVPKTTTIKTTHVVRVCAMHGGLSPFVDDSFDGIIAINRFRPIERGALADLTWSDPTSDSIPRRASPSGNAVPGRQPSTSPSASPLLDGIPGSPVVKPSALPLSVFQAQCVFRGTSVGFTGNPRGTGHIFGEDVTVDFINTNHLYFVVRAHQCVHEGFQWTHNDRLLTVFSAPNYCGMRNKGAILLLDAQSRPTVTQYSYKDDADNPLMCTASAPMPPKMFT